MKRDNKIVGRLLSCFDRSFINEANEFICLLDYRNEDVNSYFRLDNVSNELELKCKVLEYLSRPAFKGFTYAGQSWKERQIGEEIYEYHLDGIMLEDGDVYFNGKAMNDRLFVKQLVHMIKKGEIYFGLNDMNESYNPKDYYYLKKLAGE